MIRLHQLAFQECSGSVLAFPVSNNAGTQQSGIHRGIRQSFQHALSIVIVFPLNILAGQHIGCRHTGLGVPTIGRALQPIHNLLVIARHLLFFQIRHKQRAVQNRCSGVNQQITPGIFPDFFCGKVKGLLQFPLGCHLGKFVDKLPDLLLSQLLPEGKELIHVDIQQSCQRRKQGDVRIGVALFPFVHRRRRHPQVVGNLLLGQSCGLPTGFDLFTQLHPGVPPFTSMFWQFHYNTGAFLPQLSSAFLSGKKT